MNDSLRLEAGPAAARRARSFTAQTIHTWGCPVDCDDAVLIVSELSTNAVRYDGPELTVALSWHSGVLRVEVTDSNVGSDFPTLTTPASDAESGRGLQIIEALAQRWGIEDTHHGTRVWATLPTLAA